MAVIPYDCPHCGATKASFDIIGARPFPNELAKNLTGSTSTGVLLWEVYIACSAVCPVCAEPIAAVLSAQNNQVPQNIANSIAVRLTSEARSVETIGCKIKSFWPKPPMPEIPGQLPDAVNRAFGQAERNYHQAGNEEASAMMYRRALELSMIDKFPDLKGSLAKRTREMVSKHEIPSSLGDWADEIRDLGNEAAHEVGVVSKDELRQIRGFADALLRYLYTLPAEITARRKIS